MPLRGAGDAKLATGNAGQLVRFAYEFVHDSNGGHPNANAEIILVFAGNGDAFVYGSDPRGAVADLGSYTYRGGQLFLHFADSDLKVTSRFALSFADSQVTMPFQLLSSKSGTSLWRQEPLALDKGVFAVFDAAVNVTPTSWSLSKAADLADTYAQAWLRAANSTGSVHGSLRPGQREGMVQPTGQCAGDGSSCIVGVENLGSDIEISYRDAPPVFIDLAPFGAATTGTALTDSPLQSDPRVFLDPSVHHDGQFNPPNKTAVLIMPFLKPPFMPYISSATQSAVDTAAMIRILDQRGYHWLLLGEAGATVEAIVSALEQDPGIVLIHTHGDKDGNLLTGQSVPYTGSGLAEDVAAASAEARRLETEGLRSLVRYHMRNMTPMTFGVTEEQCSSLIFANTSCFAQVTLTPLFWDWLRTVKHVSFANSFVYMGACLTDRTANLRKAIEAKAYFAWQQEVSSSLDDAVMQYSVEALSRPTHSPEEVYYNLLRVDHTHQMIYKEDRLLNGELGATSDTQIAGSLDAWGWNGSSLVDYSHAGWLSGMVNPGQVWWMLYAARWLKDTTDAATALTTCLHKYWLSGSPGGLADQYCNAANAGIPKDTSGLTKDVAYAIYLLNGEVPQGFSPSETVPRWTMDD